MKCSRFTQGALITLMCLVTIIVVAAPASALTLIENGQARCTIVIPPEDKGLIAEANDLQYHLRKMSGAEVPIVIDLAEVKGVGIYIGTKPTNLHVPGRLVSRQDLWPDGYVIEVIEFDPRMNSLYAKKSGNSHQTSCPIYNGTPFQRRHTFTNP